MLRLQVQVKCLFGKALLTSNLSVTACTLPTALVGLGVMTHLWLLSPLIPVTLHTNASYVRVNVDIDLQQQPAVEGWTKLKRVIKCLV